MENFKDTSLLIAPVDCESIVRARAEFIEALTASFEQLRNAEAAYDAANIAQGVGVYRSPRFCGLPKHRFNTPHGHEIDDLDKFIKGFDAQAWDFVLDACGLKSFMGSKELGEWEERVYSKNTLCFELPVVRTAMSEMVSKRMDSLGRSVADVYRSFSWDRESKRPKAMSKRLAVSMAWRPDELMDGGKVRLVDDLLRALHVIDGVRPPAPREAFGYKQCAAKAVDVDGLENDFVRVQGFRNGSLHLHFKNLAALEALNTFAIQSLAPRGGDTIPVN